MAGKKVAFFVLLLLFAPMIEKQPCVNISLCTDETPATINIWLSITPACHFKNAFLSVR